MEIEISIKSLVSQSDLFELRNFLMKEIDNLDLTIKEQPPRQGEMVIGIIEPILLGVVTIIVNNSVQDFYNNVIKPKLLEWLKGKVDKEGKKPEVISTITNDKESCHFLENRDGETISLTDFKYSIDKNKTQVILIGTSEYDDNFPPIQPVKGNIEDLFNIVTDISHIGIPKENVSTLYNKNSNEIEEVLLRKSRLPNLQTLIIYFAGHGYRSDIKKLYLIAKNTKRIDDFILGAVDFDFVSNNILKNSRASQKILIVDACHSGIAAQGQDDLAENLDVKGTYIIASSSGDEVSYFNKNNRNTYFTEAIVNLLMNGMDDSREMVALEDLYGSTKQNQMDKNLSVPIYKNGLNIPASNFFLARNPKFSQQKQKMKPFEFFEKGLFEDALLEYRVLLSRYPDDEKLRKEAMMCENEILFQEISYEADELRNQKKYKEAIEKYQRVLRIKKDPGVAYKLNKCMKLQRGEVLITPVTDYKKDDIPKPVLAAGISSKLEVNKLKKEKDTPNLIQEKLKLNEKETVYTVNFKKRLQDLWNHGSVFKIASTTISIIMIIGFFMPWIGYDRCTAWDLSTSNKDYSTIGHEILRTIGLLIPILGGIIIYNSRTKDQKNVIIRRIIFHLPFVCLCIFTIIIYQGRNYDGLLSTKVFFNHQMEFGFWTTLICSLCLVFLAFSIRKPKGAVSNV